VGSAQAVDEVKVWPGDSHDHNILSSAARQSIGHDISGSGLVLHLEVEAGQFPHLVMLRDGGEMLIEQELEAIVICTYHETVPPKIWPLMANGEDKPDEFSLVRRQRAMAQRN
jgi:hypothetical protein